MESVIKCLDEHNRIFYNYANGKRTIGINEKAILFYKKDDNSKYIRSENEDIQILINGIEYENNKSIIINEDDKILVKERGVLVDSLNENDETVKLPWGEPMVKTYPYFTGINAILKGYDKDEMWVYNNYFLIWMYRFIHFNEYWTDFKFGNEEEQECFCKQLNKEIVKREEVDNPIEFIKKSISEKKYVFISLDMYYIPQWWGDEEKTHMKHQAYISGYNDREQIFLVSDFMGNGLYQTVQMKYNDLEKSYYDWKKDKKECHIEFGNDIWLISVNDKKEELDLDRVIGWCKDSLEGTDTRVKNYLWWEQDPWEIAYGIEYFEEYQKALDEFEVDSWFDRRPLHILDEFGKVMEKRILYMVRNGWICETDTEMKLMDDVANYRKNSEKIQNLGVKYSLRRKENTLEKLKERLSEIKIEYENVVSGLLKVCEESKANER